MEIIIYTTKTCPHCVTAKKYLTTQGLSYIEKDVSSDPLASREMSELGARGVPTLKINNQVLVGFSPQEVMRLLKTSVVYCSHCQKALRLPSEKGKLKVTCTHCKNQFEVTT